MQHAPLKHCESGVAGSNTSMNKKEMPKSTDGKLEEMLLHLRRMDQRDRMRMWGSSIKGIIGLIPALIFLYGSWYLMQNSDDILAKIAEEAAKQAAAVTEKSAGSIMEQFKNFGQ